MRDCPACGARLRAIKRLPCLRPCECGKRWKVTADGVVPSVRRLPRKRSVPRKTDAGRLPGRPLTSERRRAKPPKPVRLVPQSAAPRSPRRSRRRVETTPREIDLRGVLVDDERVVEDGSIAYVDVDGYVLASRVGMGAPQTIPPVVYADRPPDAVVGPSRVAVPVRACAFYFEIGDDGRPRCHPIPRGFEAWRAIFGESEPRRRVLSDFPTIFARRDRG